MGAWRDSSWLRRLRRIWRCLARTGDLVLVREEHCSSRSAGCSRSPENRRSGNVGRSTYSSPSGRGLRGGEDGVEDAVALTSWVSRRFRRYGPSRRESQPPSAPTTSPTSGARGTSVIKLTTMPSASPVTAPIAIAAPGLTRASLCRGRAGAVEFFHVLSGRCLARTGDLLLVRQTRDGPQNRARSAPGAGSTAV